MADLKDRRVHRERETGCEANENVGQVGKRVAGLQCRTRFPSAARGASAAGNPPMQPTASLHRLHSCRAVGASPRPPAGAREAPAQLADALGAAAAATYRQQALASASRLLNLKPVLASRKSAAPATGRGPPADGLAARIPQTDHHVSAPRQQKPQRLGSHNKQQHASQRSGSLENRQQPPAAQQPAAAAAHAGYTAPATGAGSICSSARQLDGGAGSGGGPAQVPSGIQAGAARPHRERQEPPPGRATPPDPVFQEARAFLHRLAGEANGVG